MDRKKQIIISISGIVIVVLLLLTFSYAYYVTNVDGNTSSKSVEVTTSISTVKYTDLTTEDISEIISPGYTNTKVFTVQNIGNAVAKYTIYLRNVVNTFNRTEDITYKLYRNIGNNTIDTSNLSNYTLVSSGTLPITDSTIAIDETLSVTDEYYTYALFVEYANLESTDQSEDMNKRFSYNVQLYGTSYELNPYNEGTLSYNILNNALTKSNGESSSIYRTIPLTNIATGISTEDERILSFADDDTGISYYYRGNISDNYINFNGMCWRIVRIEGDGSVKLILSDSTGTCSSTSTSLDDDSAFINAGNYGYKDDNSNDYNNTLSRPTSMKKILDDWYNTNILTNQSYLKSDSWCIKETNINLARMTCGEDDTKIISYIGTLTSDEILFAGAKSETENNNLYLVNNAKINWWLLSQASYNTTSSVSILSSTGSLTNALNNTTNSIRPSIVLKNGLTSTGNGTIDNPFEVSNAS